jgi:hypothetical protein
VAEPCTPTHIPERNEASAVSASVLPPLPPFQQAGDGTRTRDPQLGRLMLYQLSYTRISAGKRDSGEAGKRYRPPVVLVTTARRSTLLPRFPAFLLPR